MYNNDMKKVEQVSLNNRIVYDYDQTLKKSELFSLIKSVLSGFEITKDDKQILINRRIGIIFSNLTYLGNPHKEYKKRIQLKKYYPEFYAKNNNNGIKTIFLGIYTYNSLHLFVVFNTFDYINNNFNNSSAHVYTTDLQNGYAYGFARRVDRNNNEILIFTKDRFIQYISSLINSTETYEDIEYQKKLLTYFKNFFFSIPGSIYGLDAYKNMIADDYSKKGECEWCGFYFEYLFDKFYIKNKTDLINRKVLMDYYDENGNKVVYDGSNNNPDLDLKFPLIENFYGDLKSDNISAGIQGNDYETVHDIIKNGGTIWYVLMEFDPKLDKYYESEVQKFWYKYLRKDSKKTTEKSYIERMKHEIVIKEYKILNINKFTWKYVSIYNQGKNSNGKERKPKISIPKKFVDIMQIYSFKCNKI